MTKHYEIRTQIQNNHGAWETLDIEYGSRSEFDYGEVSSSDIGGEPGREIRVQLVDPDDPPGTVVETRHETTT